MLYKLRKVMQNTFSHDIDGLIMLMCINTEIILLPNIILALCGILKLRFVMDICVIGLALNPITSDILLHLLWKNKTT